MVIFAIVFMTIDAHTYNIFKTYLMMFKPRAKSRQIWLNKNIFCTVLVEVLKCECFINSTAIYLHHRSNRILLDKSILHFLVGKYSGGVNTKALMF